MGEYVYPARLEEGEDGRFLVRFRDLPDALTDGASVDDALSEAADCLDAALVLRMREGEAIPVPSAVLRGEYAVVPLPVTALKAALHDALRARQATAADLARALDIDHKEARRILDPVAPTKLPRLTEALSALDYVVSVSTVDRSASRRPQGRARPRPAPPRAPRRKPGAAQA